MLTSRHRLLVALSAALLALAVLAPALRAEPPLPQPGSYSSHLSSRHYLGLTGWTVRWKVHELNDGAHVTDIRECPDHPRAPSPSCYRGDSGYLWEDSRTLVWHVRLKFPDDFQVDGHWNRHGGGLMCYLHGHGEREHTHLNCSPHPFGFSD
jgi:hypothetical protein